MSRYGIQVSNILDTVQQNKGEGKTKQREKKKNKRKNYNGKYCIVHVQPFALKEPEIAITELFQTFTLCEFMMTVQ